MIKLVRKNIGIYLSKYRYIILNLFFVFGITTISYAGHQEDSWLYNRQGMQKIQEGRLMAAIKDFEIACRLDPFNDTAITNLACARNNYGVLLAKKRNYTEAIRQLLVAKAQKPEDISIRLNLLSLLVCLKRGAEVEKESKEIMTLRPADSDTGLKVVAALQKTENNTMALTVLQNLSEKPSANSRVHAVLGKLLYRNGQIIDSQYHLMRSLELDSNNEGTKKLLEQMSREAELKDSNTNYTSVHFELTCPRSFSDEWANEMLKLLEDAYNTLGEHLDFYPSQRSQVLILQTEDFRRIHDLPEWAGGVYDGRIRLPVPVKNIRPHSLKGAIMHEYTHHVIYLLTSGNCPIWLNEGIAQIFEHGDNKTFSKSDNQTMNFSSFEELEKSFKDNPSRSEASILYSTSLYLVRKIVNEYDWHRVAELLVSLGRGYEFKQAVIEIFSDEQEELENNMFLVEDNN